MTICHSAKLYPTAGCRDCMRLFFMQKKRQLIHIKTAKQLTMNKKFLLLMGIFSIGILHAQVGINTEDPQGVFHVATDNNTTADLVVSSDGNVGIGTLAPTAKLHIKSDSEEVLRIKDGSQVQGYIMKSDANGVGNWQLSGIDFGVIEWRVYNPAGYRCPGARITADNVANMELEVHNLNVASVNAAVNGVTVPAGRYLIFANGDITGEEYATVYLRYGSGDAQFNMEHYLSGLSEVTLATPTTVYLEFGGVVGASGNMHVGLNNCGNDEMWYKLTFLKLE